MVPAEELPSAPQRHVPTGEVLCAVSLSSAALVIPLPRKYNVVPRRREAGDTGSLERGKPTEPGHLTSTRICVVFLWMLQCGGGSVLKNLSKAVGGLCLASWRSEGVADGKQN